MYGVWRAECGEHATEQLQQQQQQQRLVLTTTTPAALLDFHRRRD